MSSSFRRKSPSKGDDGANGMRSNAEGESGKIHGQMRGWKPSVNNSLGLVSSGHKELDDLLGGGLNLGTIMMVNSDIHSNHADTLLSYMMAESLSMGHGTLFVTSDEASGGETLLGSLPFNRTLNSTISKIEENQAEDRKEEDAKSHLKVAWQYAKYIKSSSSKTSSSSSSLIISGSHYCCSYDLAKRMQEPIIEANMPQLYCAPCDEEGDGDVGLAKALDSYLDNILSFISALSSNTNEANVARVFLHRFDRILAVHGETARPSVIVTETSRFFTRLRIAIRCKRVSVVVSACPAVLPICLLSRSRIVESEARYNKLVQWAQSAITVETFAGRADQIPAEFSRFCAFLEVVAIQHVGTLVPRRPSALRFGLLRDRRKLHVEPLHLPPEESRAQGSSGTDERLEAKAKKLFGDHGVRVSASAFQDPALHSHSHDHDQSQTRPGGGKTLSYETNPAALPSADVSSTSTNPSGVAPARDCSHDDGVLGGDGDGDDVGNVDTHRSGPHHNPSRHTSRGFKRLNLNAPLPGHISGKAIGGINISSFSKKKATEMRLDF